MKRRFLAASLLPIALVLGGMTVGPGASEAAPSTTPDPVKIMFNGDSISQEFAGDFTWRYRLYKLFQSQGKAVSFVGPNVTPYRVPWAPSTLYHVTTGWQSNHFAYGGSRLYQYLDQPGTAYNIAPQITKYQPDVLVSFLGTNDLLESIKGLDPSDPNYVQDRDDAIDTVVTNYVSFVQAVRAADPNHDVKIVLGQVMTHNLAPAVRDEYNTELEQRLVDDPEYNNPGAPLAIAQLNADQAQWGSSTYTYDLTHPTPTGEMLIAQRFAQALQVVDPDLFAQAPALSQKYIPWTPPIAPRITIKSRRIYVNTLASLQRWGVQGIKVNLMSTKSKRSATSAFKKSAYWNSGRLAPGYYRIKIQGFRANMLSSWTKSYTVRVRKR